MTRHQFHKLIFSFFICLMFTPSLFAQRKDTTIRYQGMRYDQNNPANNVLLNPERGFRDEIMFESSSLKSQMWGRAGFDYLPGTIINTRAYGGTVIQTYFYLYKYIGKNIPDSAIRTMKTILDKYRMNGMKALVRFTYDWADPVGNNLWQEVQNFFGNFEKKEANPSIGLYDYTVSDIQRHISNLKSFMHEYADVIYAFQFGWVGAWGEWHSSTYQHNKYPDATAAIANSFMAAIPATHKATFRLPEYKNNANLPAYDYLNRVGFNNDFFTMDTHMDAYGSGDYTYYIPDRKYSFEFGRSIEIPGTNTNKLNPVFQQVRAEAPTTIMDGEMPYGYLSDFQDWKKNLFAHLLNPLPGLKSYSRMLAHSYSTFSYVHNVDITVAAWKKEMISESDLLRENPARFDYNYFRDKNNQLVKRSAFELIRDHLGYRLQARQASFPAEIAKGQPLNLSLQLENVGMASPIKTRYGYFVLLNPDDSTVAVTSRPVDFNITRMFSKEYPEFSYIKNVNALLPTDALTSGKRYLLGFWLPDVSPSIKEEPAFAIRLANDEMPWYTPGGKYGINILGSLSITAPDSVQPPAPGGVHQPGTGLVNGLRYDLYDVPMVEYSLDKLKEGIYGTQLHSGYTSSGYYFYDNINQKANGRITAVLSGSVHVGTAGTYEFTIPGIDDYGVILVNGQIVFSGSFGKSSVITPVRLSAPGLYPIEIRYSNTGGVGKIVPQWRATAGGGDLGSASFTQIADSRFYTKASLGTWYKADDGVLVSDLTTPSTIATVISSVNTGFALPWDNSPTITSSILTTPAGIPSGKTNIVHGWKDQSANTWPSHLSGYNNPRLDTNVAGMNFNPSIILEGRAHLKAWATNNLAYRQQGHTLITVAAPDKIENGTYSIVAYGNDAGSRTEAQSIISRGSFCSGTGGTAGYLLSSGSIRQTPLPFIGTGVYRNHHIHGAIGNLFQYVNGGNSGAAINDYTSNKQMNNNADLYIGAEPDNGNFYTGRIAEVISYPWTLSLNELQRVHSYLAIKYGITLDKGQSDYLFSDSVTTMWQAGTDTTFVHDIAGIARDDASGLLQKQSHSNESQSFVIIGAETIAASNAANNAVISADKTALVWSANTAASPVLLSSAHHSVLTHGFNSILQKRWRVQQTGEGLAGASLRIAIPAINDVITDSASYLIISKTGAFNGMDEQYYQLTVQGTYWYADVPAQVLSSGTYFSFGTRMAAPGGVLPDLTLWFKANQGVYSDEGSTTAVTGSNNVRQWKNYAPNIHIPFVGHSTFKPNYNLNAINYNPVIVFNGSDDRLELNSVASASWRNSNEHAIYAVVLQSGQSGSVLLHQNSDNNTGRTGMGLMQSSRDNGILTAAIPVNIPVLLSTTFTSSRSNGFMRSVNGMKQVQSTVSGTATVAGNAGNYLAIGRNAAEGGGTPGAMIAEVIAYRTNQQADPLLQARIESYLAIKYGLTLGSPSSPYSYLSSSGITVWPGSVAYQYNVAGIGRDDASALYQKQSRSSYMHNAGQVTIGLGSIGTSNQLNTASFTNRHSYLLWGDNGVTTSLANDIGSLQAYAFPYNGNTDNLRMNRTWKVHNTNLLQDVTFSADATIIGTGATVSAQQLCLLVATDEFFSTNLQVVPLTLQNGSYVCSATFPEGSSYFTVARLSQAVQTSTITASRSVAATPPAAVAVNEPAVKQPQPAAVPATLPGITLFPNPAGSIVNIELTGYTTAVQAILCDEQGETIRPLTLKPGANRLDCSALAQGIYYIRIRHQNNNITKKLIIAR